MECVQKMRNDILDHLDNYSESVCIDCGFVQRDCKCVDAERRHGGSQMTFLGSAVAVKDCGMQTEPMVVVGMQEKVNTPGIPVYVPQNFLLSSNVRMPLTFGQQNPLTVPSAPLNASGVSINPLTPSVISLPPGLSFPAGCPPSFVNPLPASASPQSGVSVLRPPLLGGTTVPNSSSIVIQAPNDNASDTAHTSHKRKLDTDASDVNVAHAAVQTTGKSYVKKMKIRLGSFSASDFKIVGRESNSLLNKNQASANVQGVTTDSGNVTDGQTPTGTVTTASPGGRVVDVRKDGETTVEKKFTTVWKLLEESSDDECAPDEPTSASQDVPASTPTDKNCTVSQEPNDKDAGPSNDDPLLTPKTEPHVNDESVEQAGLVAAGDSLPESNEDSGPNSSDPLLTPKTEPHVNDESVEQARLAAVPESLTESNEHDVRRREDHSLEEDDEDKLVIDTCADDFQRSEQEDKSTVLQQSNDWQFRNGVKESASPGDENEGNKSTDDAEQVEAECMDDGEVKPSAAGDDGDRCQSVPDASDTSRPPDSLPPESTAGSAVTDAEVGTAPVVGSIKSESVPKPRRVYRKFEYTPTGEHILRCLVPKCSQTFDRKLAADVHSHVHPGFVPDTEGSEGPMYLQCHQCEFQAPFYHWYDLLRHMRQKHDICLTDGTAEHTCEYCGLGFDSKDLLVSHIDFHYSNRYKCIYCGLLLLTWGQVTLL